MVFLGRIFETEKTLGEDDEVFTRVQKLNAIQTKACGGIWTLSRNSLGESIYLQTWMHDTPAAPYHVYSR